MLQLQKVNPMKPCRIDFDEIPWEAPIEGLRAKAVERDGRKLRLVEYFPEMEPHWCDRGHCGYVLEGRFEIRFDSETVVVEEGDGIFIPPGREHRHMGRVLSDRVRVVFVEDA